MPVELTAADDAAIESLNQSVAELEAALEKVIPDTTANTSGISFEYHIWGFEVIMDEKLTKQVIDGTISVSTLADLLGKGLGLIPKVGPVLSLVSKAFAEAIKLKAKEIKWIDKGYGVYWPITIPQMLIVIASASGGPASLPAIILAILVFIHPLPNGEPGKAKPFPDGTRVSNGPKGRETVYLILDEELRGITSEDAYNNLFKDWKGIRGLKNLDDYRRPGPPINEKNTSLIVSESEQAQPPRKKGTVYLRIDDHKRWVPNPATFAKYNFNWAKVKPLSNAELNAIPDGPALV